ncbi:GAF domain-containing protein [Stigmatella aurantiaca]|uniref:histidine kinase n=2 Tax=Stigmatella aurantiaca (strain DW4/3-1) TaxID=378806 RepID=E3FT15_STIAD|nr:GAF domain-containing protein [Stigmatella aurantiaca]ADO75825.1 Sensor protein [Stigmatella aurantiaca DW4/3-1]
MFPADEEQYRHFDGLHLGLCVIREEKVVYANASMLSLLGRTVNEVVGQSFRVLVTPAGAEEMHELFTHLLRGERVPAVYESTLNTSHGPRRAELSITTEAQDVMVMARDLSARARHRAALQHLAELGAGLPGLRTDEEVLRRVFTELTKLGFTFAYLIPEHDRLRLERLWISPSGTVSRGAGRWMEGLLGVWSPMLKRTWKEGSAYSADFAWEASHFVPPERSEEVLIFLQKAGLHLVGVRIDSADGPRAMLVVAAEWFREEEQAPLRLFGAQVSAALEAALTISQLSAKNTALAALNRLASTAATALEPRAFFEPGAQEITRLLGCDTVGLFLRSDEASEAELVFSHGLDAATREFYLRMPLRGSLSGVALQQGMPLVLDAEECFGFTRDNMLRLGYATVAVVPLRVSSRLVGTLVVSFFKRRLLTPLERETLQAMGTHFAAATDSHRLLTEVRRRADDLALIQEVGRNMVATLEMDLLMQIGVEGLSLIAGVPEAMLMLLDSTGQRLEIRATVRQGPEVLGYTLPIWPPDSSLAAAALNGRAPVLVQDMSQDPRVYQELKRMTGGTAALVLPLVVRERAIGVAVLLEKKGPRQFTPSELERASAIANQLALALEQARLIEDLKKSYAELARAQQQLVQRERLAALGELSAVVAHEVRNPLGAIFNSVATIRRMVGPFHPSLPLVDIVGEEADRLNRIVDDLLNFARPPSPSPMPVPLRKLLEDVVRGAMADASNNIRVEWALEPDVPPVLADERMIRQAFLNLAINSVQAMLQGGTLRVGARRVPGPRHEVQVEFTDTGSGIPSDVRARIFEPFFTTKAKGTGLGLALVKRIVEAHAGSVSLESQPGQGTTFRLLLPSEPDPLSPGLQPGV